MPRTGPDEAEFARGTSPGGGLRAMLDRPPWIGIAALVLLLAACSSAPKREWRKHGMEPDSTAMRDLRAKDLADCTTRAGAPTQGTQSTLSYSRAQIADCMHARGWRELSVGEPASETVEEK